MEVAARESHYHPTGRTYPVTGVTAASATARITALHRLAQDLHTGGAGARHAITVGAGLAHPDLAPAELRTHLISLGIALHRREHSVHGRDGAAVEVRRRTWALLHPPTARPCPSCFAEMSRAVPAVAVLADGTDRCAGHDRAAVAAILRQRTPGRMGVRV